MTDLEQYKLIEIFLKYKNINLSPLNFFVLILRPSSYYNNIFASLNKEGHLKIEKNIIDRGNYASLYKTKIWVSRSLQTDDMQIFDQDIVTFTHISEIRWSPIIKLSMAMENANYIDRLLKLTAFL